MFGTRVKSETGKGARRVPRNTAGGKALRTNVGVKTEARRFRRVSVGDRHFLPARFEGFAAGSKEVQLAEQRERRGLRRRRSIVHDSGQ